MMLDTKVDDVEAGRVEPASMHSNEQEEERIHGPQHVTATSLPTLDVEDDKAETICQEQAPRGLSQQQDKRCCAWARFEGVPEAQVS